MNREIKFRGFCKEKNSWVYGMLSKIPKFGETFRYVIVDVLRDEKDGEFNGLIFLNDEVEEDSISQYTGINDMYKKEIYEKDIVYFNVAPSERFKGSDWVYDQNGAVEIYKHFTLFGNWQSQYCCDIKITGNVFENPELLK